MHIIKRKNHLTFKLTTFLPNTFTICGENDNKKSFSINNYKVKNQHLGMISNTIGYSICRSWARTQLTISERNIYVNIVVSLLHLKTKGTTRSINTSDQLMFTSF